MNLPVLTYRRFCTEDLLEFPDVMGKGPQENSYITSATRSEASTGLPCRPDGARHCRPPDKLALLNWAEWRLRSRPSGSSRPTPAIDHAGVPAGRRTFTSSPAALTDCGSRIA